MIGVLFIVWYKKNGFKFLGVYLEMRYFVRIIKMVRWLWYLFELFLKVYELFCDDRWCFFN